VFKCAAFVGVLFVLTGAGVLIVKNWPATQPKPTSEETAVTERLDVLNVETNAALPSELADYYISELDDMTGQTNDADQLFDLQMNRVKVYINSGRYEEAIKTEEDLLATGDLTEKQRFHIYISMADTYI
jgi:lipopolysaccharide biosynthesis regulator YciM